MPIHTEPRRKHRKRNGSRLTEAVCANLTAYNVIHEDCNCGKKCFEAAIRANDFDIVVDVVKYCQSELRDKPYDEKFNIMRPKVTGKLFTYRLIG